MVRSTRVTFPGASGDALAARYDEPVGPVRATALFAHCFTCSKDLLAASRISRALAQSGVGVLRFDFTGLGHSEGEFENTDFSSNVDDLVAAADYLREHHAAPSLLVGHSLGGTAVLASASRVPEAKAVVSIGSPSTPTHLHRLLAGSLEEIQREGAAEVVLAGRTFRIRREFLTDLETHPLEARIASLKKALLVLHAPMDAQVGIENASEIFLAAKHPKSFVSLDDADHLLTRVEDAEYAAEVIASWASRYLPPRPATERSDVEPGEVLVEETGYGRYANDVVVGPHVLRADEPPSVGGDDTGPTPYGLLSAALGACTTMTLRMYAERKQWPLERVSVRIAHEKIHAKDCAECETQTGKIDRFDRALHIEGPALSEEQRERLVEIADRCPVHRTLHSEVIVRTRVEG